MHVFFGAGTIGRKSDAAPPSFFDPPFPKKLSKCNAPDGLTGLDRL
jgi:hypothetical protein